MYVKKTNWSFYNRTLPKSNLKSGSAPEISEWTFQCKMSFNPDLSMQAQEVVFSLKTHEISHPKINFNNSPVVLTEHLAKTFRAVSR